jgi:hypothetical protein
VLGALLPTLRDFGDNRVYSSKGRQALAPVAGLNTCWSQPVGFLRFLLFSFPTCFFTPLQ